MPCQGAHLFVDSLLPGVGGPLLAAQVARHWLHEDVVEALLCGGGRVPHHVLGDRLDVVHALAHARLHRLVDEAHVERARRRHKPLVVLSAHLVVWAERECIRLYSIHLHTSIDL